MVRSRTVLIAGGVMALVGCLLVSDVGYADPIVRIRDGDAGSISITSLPFTFLYTGFTFGTNPSVPSAYAEHCTAYGSDPFSENGLPIISCSFVNSTGGPISFLNFAFAYNEQYPPEAPFVAEAPTAWFQTQQFGTQFSADFSGTGIPSQSSVCYSGDVGGVFCTDRHFFVDLLGFPLETQVTMTAATAVPEPATLSLLAAGLAALAIRRRRK